uniref:CSON013682 protein n=1 Tax=Culicoides sonorensis TaxID=179676 RepID=A0A336LUV8_CULSO
MSVLRSLFIGSIISIISRAVLSDDFYTFDHTFIYQDIKDCKNNEYYDINNFICKRCEPGYNLIPSKDKLLCICDSTSVVQYHFDNILQRPICQKSCENAKTCFSAPNESEGKNTLLTSSSNKSKCHLKLMNYTIYSSHRINVQIYDSLSNTDCTCNLTTHAIYLDEFCVPLKLLSEYQQYQTFKSNPLYNEMKFLMLFCHLVKNQTACQQLANLCILSHYSMNRHSPCHQFYTTQTSEIATSNYNERMRPFLFYRKGKYAIELFDKALDFKYNIEDDMPNNTINFLLVTFNIHGQLIHIRPFNLMHDLNICSKFSGGKINHVRFARNWQDACNLNLNSWIEHEKARGMTFMSLYISYWENNHRMVKTVPVLVRNIFGTKNDEENIEEWTLVKRFTLIDILSGANVHFREEKYQEPKFEHQFNYVRYVKSVELRFKIHDHNKRSNRISVPLLVIDYGVLNSTEANQVENINFEFKINFSKHYSFDYLLEILLPIFIILAFTMAIFQTVCYKIRQNKIFYDIEIFSNFLIFLCSTIANALFLVVIIISIYVLCSYKSQQNVKILLPIAEQEALEVFIYAAVVFKFVKILRHFWLQVNVDIFFIDWERPKVFESTSRNYFDTPSIASGVTTKHTTVESVSAWRMYFIANEWQELMTKRKISFLAHFILLCLVFFVFGFQNWSSTDFILTTGGGPFHADHFSLNKNTKTDKILKLAVGIIVYSSVYFIQIIYNFIFHERYIDNPIQNFVDVCSISNISVLILSMTSYGFYIHGRSPHGFADTDMCSMIMQFRREEENMCGHRGLLPGSEQQTYTILAPRNLRLMYERLINQAKKTSNISAITHHGAEGFFNGASTLEYTSDKILASYFNINRFFSAFIDHALKDLDYVIQEKSIIEQIMDCELQTYINESKGIFYIDNGHSFDKVLFYGNEFLLATFELMLFCLILILTDDFLFSILIVGISFKIFSAVVEKFSKTNLAKKTLIDKRFLI